MTRAVAEDAVAPGLRKARAPAVLVVIAALTLAGYLGAAGSRPLLAIR